MSFHVSAQFASSDLPINATMIRPLCDGGVGTRACFVSKTFTVPSPSSTQTLRISALGLTALSSMAPASATISSRRGGRAITSRLSYQTYEVGHLLRGGENIIEIWLGDGWYRSPMGWEGSADLKRVGPRTAAIAELRAPPARSSFRPMRPGKAACCPSTETGIYYGETFDARNRRAAQRRYGARHSVQRATLVPHEVDGVPVSCTALRSINQFSRRPRAARSTTSARTARAM